MPIRFDADTNPLGNDNKRRQIEILNALKHLQIRLHNRSDTE